LASRTLRLRLLRHHLAEAARLTEAKKIAGHGEWLTWLEREFEWSNATASKYMQVAELAGKFELSSNLSLGVSDLYLLARPSTPEPIREEIIQRAALPSSPR
jgi:hypothetical protein